MKVHLGWVFAAAVLTFGLTLVASRSIERIIRAQDVSIAGQTLANLSRALEAHKASAGSYPESLSGLTVEPAGGDFSAELLRHIIYRQTGQGFVAFVGLPGVAYIEPGQPSRYEFAR